MSIGKTELFTDVIAYGIPSTFAVTRYSEEDISKLKRMFELLSELNFEIATSGGTQYGLTSLMSEAMYCLWSGSVRYLSADKARKEGFSFTERLTSASLDTYSEANQEAEQLKSTICKKDPISSFGPSSDQDITYLLNFFNNSNLDGTFDVYRIPNHYFEGITCNKQDDGSFVEVKINGKRPRFSLTTKIIEANNIAPLATKIKLW
jgi:hypothetical protein